MHVMKCNYYLETLFNSEITNETATFTAFSMCHVNIHSAEEKILGLLKIIKFTVIDVAGFKSMVLFV